MRNSKEYNLKKKKSKKVHIKQKVEMMQQQMTIPKFVNNINLYLQNIIKKKIKCKRIPNTGKNLDFSIKKKRTRSKLLEDCPVWKRTRTNLLKRKKNQLRALTKLINKECLSPRIWKKQLRIRKILFLRNQLKHLNKQHQYKLSKFKTNNRLKPKLNLYLSLSLNKKKLKHNLQASKETELINHSSNPPHKLQPKLRTSTNKQVSNQGYLQASQIRKPY